MNEAEADRLKLLGTLYDDPIDAHLRDRAARDLFS